MSLCYFRLYSQLQVRLDWLPYIQSQAEPKPLTSLAMTYLIFVASQTDTEMLVKGIGELLPVTKYFLEEGLLHTECPDK